MEDYLFLANQNPVWLHLTLKKEHFWCDLFSQKGDLVENSFGPGKKAYFKSLYLRMCSQPVFVNVIHVGLYDCDELHFSILAALIT